MVNLLLPASPKDIAEAIERLRCARLLHGFRGQPGVDIARLAARIAALCTWFTAQQLREVEINPLALRGDRAWALDALITPQSA